MASFSRCRVGGNGGIGMFRLRVRPNPFPTIVDTAILYPYEPGPDSSGPSPVDTSVMERCDGEEDLAEPQPEYGLPK